MLLLGFFLQPITEGNHEIVAIYLTIFSCNCRYRCNRRKRARPLLMLILPSKLCKIIRSAWKESRFPFPLKQKLSPQICWIKKIVKTPTLMHLPKSWKLQALQQKHRFINVFWYGVKYFVIHLSYIFLNRVSYSLARALQPSQKSWNIGEEIAWPFKKVNFTIEFTKTQKLSKVEVQNLLVLLSIDYFIANIKWLACIKKAQIEFWINFFSFKTKIVNSRVIFSHLLPIPLVCFKNSNRILQEKLEFQCNLLTKFRSEKYQRKWNPCHIIHQRSETLNFIFC